MSNPAENWGVLEILAYVEEHPGCIPADVCIHFVPEYQDPAYNKEPIRGKVKNSMSRLVKQGYIRREPTEKTRKFVYYGVEQDE